ncbi:retrograde transport, endosome to Golgi-related protein [Pseudozyma hubeiensis SY62]|uniref:Vacuolar protein sorting-associated protein 54 n=1 Tax=Pseudozyma hubeiensis (strain SY62) TaxID=1305764 RepID=R9P7T2_PSEHS|nr:retrograde transport, endosome to Golgi-related protein [Pseudozyma hubeiensis SY62]GAC97411.1 retrograde transport, endosome to Golgi-related protein [Pseudozyma hubeiensis SY62]
MPSTSAGDQTASSTHFRNGITSPGSPGSEADSTINSTAFASSVLASRLGRGIYSSAGAASSSLSLSVSGFNSPALALTGFNAVSTVLNNPSKRQHPIDPKSSRFPPVTPNHVPADIPKVKKAELDSYLSSVRPEWDRFMRNQSMGRQGKATIEQQQQQQRQQRRSSAHDSSHDSEPLGQHTSRHRSTNSIASLSSDLQAVPPPQARKRLPNLSAVPQVFFSEEFDLGNPYTFDQVTERYKVATTSPSEQNGGAPEYDVALNEMLQEKLSYYSDVIEQHLIIEIGQQSSSFFAALENLNDLNAEAESCLRKIDHLKSELEHIDENQAKKGLKVVQQQQHRRQLERKQAVVQDVRQLVERRDLVQLLLQQGETEEALDLLNKLRSTLRRTDGHDGPVKTDMNGATRTDPVITLSNLQCLASVSPQLHEMEQALSGMLEQNLVAILRQDIETRLENFSQNRNASTSSADGNIYFATDSVQSGGLTLQSETTASEPPLTPAKTPTSPFGHSARTLSSHDSDLASRIAPLVVGLARTEGIEKAVTSYRDVAIRAVRETWKETLSQSGEEMAETVKWLLAEDLPKYDDHDDLPAPAARIRDLEHGTFLNVSRNLFETLMECLKGVDAQCTLVLRILNGLASESSSSHGETTAVGDDKADPLSSGVAPSTKLPSPPTMPRGVPTALPAKLSDVVVASAEQAHSLCARLLTLRATTHAALELPPFLVVFQLCWSFVLSSEQLCRKMIVGLRGTVLGQAKGFLANFHRRRIERAAKAVEEETWAQADVGAHIQSQIRQIVSSAVQDPSDFVVTAGDGQSDATVEATGDTDVDQAASSTKTLDIEDRQYFVVHASLDVLALLVDYLKVVINLPLLTTEAMARVVEFLKQFNSRTCQVVLGAGAMRSAGLKNITAKHLALASQSLSIMISLIPYIRETVRRHLSPKQAVMLTEFDKLRRDFQEHQYEIHAKLVAIMSDRLTVHCRTLSALDWNADKAAADEKPQEDENKDAEPNRYAADLVKETATLHKVLSKYLQPVVVEHVIGQVLRATDARIAQEFEKIPIKNQRAIDRMQTDVRYLETKLSVLKHVEWKDEALQQVLATKHVPHAAPAVNVSASTGPSTPNSESVPGSPALDKPAASPFGPVTYKPRIPNIFARRQQQQLNQSGSPRASTDVPPSSTPGETQRSVESTPRTSLQIQQQQPASATLGSQQAASSAPESSKGLSTSVARSIEEEASGVPPTPPSKGHEIQSTASVIVQTGDTDAGEEEDLVAPVVPAPEAVARVLEEGGKFSSDLADPSAAPEAGDAIEPVKKATPNEAADTGHSPQDEQSQANADAATPVASHDGAQDQATQVAKTTTTKPDEASDAGIKTSLVSASAGLGESETRRPSTPKKDSFSAAAVAAEASPARSGASTPAGTPVKLGRMSLKERLAEAARKRAQQSSSAARPSSQPEAPTTTTAAAQPSETALVDLAAAAADTTLPEANVAENIDQSSASEPLAESQPQKQNSLGTVGNAQQLKESEEPKRTSDPLTKTAAGETRADSAAEASEKAVVDASKEAEASELGPTSDSAAAQPADEQAAKVDGDASRIPSPTDTTEPSEQVPDHAVTPAEAHVDREGDNDDDGDINGDDAEGEADGDANETTNDSAPGGGSGSSSKKNKKKKKKGKKK